MPQPNDHLGPYKLLKYLGRGAFGEVWKAQKRQGIAPPCAIKLPIGYGIKWEDIEKEARVWLQASGHPNVLPMIEADVYDGQIVLVSEYAADGSLLDWLRQHGGKAPSMEKGIEVIASVLAGLEHLHQRHIIHRDLKPANILLQGEIPRLADFGISRILETNDPTYSEPIGTPAYMAPEAFDGKRTEQTDLWSIGVILYQLLVGHLPFPQRNRESQIKAIIMNPPDSLPSDLPAPLRAVVQRTLEKDPNSRYKNAATMRQHLLAILAGLRVQSPASTESLIDTVLDDYQDHFRYLPEIDNELGPATSDIFDAAPSPYGTHGLVRRYLKGSIYFIGKKGISTRSWPVIKDNTSFRLRDSLIGRSYESRGGTGSQLGFPLENRGTAWDNTWHKDRKLSGKVQWFEGGNIYQLSGVGAHAVLNGPIMAKFIECEERMQKEGHEWTGGVLGFPISDEHAISSRFGEKGTMQRFAYGCVIAWSKGVWNVICGHYDIYQSIGEWTGELGFPLSDEFPYTSKVSKQEGCVQWFENGCLQWNYHEDNGYYLFGPIHTKWREEDARLGFALNSASVIQGCLQQDFEGGRILLRNDGTSYIEYSH